MIRCLLVHITRNRRGQPIREERIIVGDTLRIGRGSDCKVHLPDPRVNLHHAIIKNADDGKLYIEGEGATLNINGAFEQSSKLRPGTLILVGPYELSAEARSGDHDFILTVELAQPLPDDYKELKSKARITLAAAGLSKRLPALGLALIVALLFLLFPVLNVINPAFRQAAASLPVAPDESWDPGTLSAGHQSFGKKCKECHDKPFEHVQDKTCVTCHKTIGAHVEGKTLQQTGLGDTRCAQCHRDHKGLKGLVRSDASLCVDCHGAIKSKNMKTALPDIHDFLKDHPVFQVSFKTGPSKKDVMRVLQDGKNKLVEKSGLKFPHDVHLEKKGVKSPNGKVVMECRNCHTPDEAGVRFKPIVMKDHCADCHRLEFEPAVTTRQAPHGSERAVMTTLREFYSSIAIGEIPIDVTTVDGLLRRPNEAKSEVQRRNAMEWANAKANAIAADLFEVRVCKECHTVTKNADDSEAPWKVAPVNITAHWLPKARFEHFKHRTYECVECHDVAKSKKSEDVAIPDIKKCQECHVGSTPVKNKIASTCETCHGFHLGSHRSASAATTVLAPGSKPVDPAVNPNLKPPQ